MIKFEEPAEKAFVWGFYHGRYGDSWSILHILSGTLLAVAAIFLDMSLVLAYTIVVLLLFAYELGEAIFGIVEDVENSIFDVIFGLVGFFAVLGWHNWKPISGNDLLVLFGCLSVAAASLLFVGFRRYSAHRKSDKHDNVLRSSDTSQGRSEIKRDNILFFGAVSVLTPLLLINEKFGMFMSVIFFVIGFVGIACIARRAARN